MSDQDEWVRRGPESEWRVFGITPPALGQLVESLTESTYTEPVAVEIAIDDDNTGSVPLKVVITSLHTVYVGVMPMKTDTTPAGCYPYPNYRFEGWLLKSGFDPYEGIIRVRGLLMVEGTSPEAMSAQLAFPPPAFQGYREAR